MRWTTQWNLHNNYDVVHPSHVYGGEGADATELWLSDGARRLLATMREAIDAGASGEVVASEGDLNARIYLHAGRIAWVVSSNQQRSLVSLLLGRTTLSREDLKSVFEACNRAQTNFADTLVEWQLVDRATIREILLEHFGRCLAAALDWNDASVLFVPERRAYRSALSFELDDVLEVAWRLGPYAADDARERFSVPPMPGDVDGGERDTDSPGHRTIPAPPDVRPEEPAAVIALTASSTLTAQIELWSREASVEVLVTHHARDVTLAEEGRYALALLDIDTLDVPVDRFLSHLSEFSPGQERILLTCRAPDLFIEGSTHAVVRLPEEASRVRELLSRFARQRTTTPPVMDPYLAACAERFVGEIPELLAQLEGASSEEMSEICRRISEVSLTVQSVQLARVADTCRALHEAGVLESIGPFVESMAKEYRAAFAGMRDMLRGR